MVAGLYNGLTDMGTAGCQKCLSPDEISSIDDSLFVWFKDSQHAGSNGDNGEYTSGKLGCTPGPAFPGCRTDRLPTLANKRYGFSDSHYYEHWTIPQLEAELSQGYPVIVGVWTFMDRNLGHGHWMVLVGLDDTWAWVNDPGRSVAHKSKGNYFSYPRSIFDAAWADEGRVVVIHPPPDLSAQANLLVSSANANSIFRFDRPTGSFIQKFDNSSVLYPYSLALGRDGYLYTATADAGGSTSSQIDQYDPTTGHLVASFGSLPGTRGMTIGPDGLIYVSAFEADQVWRYDPSTLAFFDVFSNVARPGAMTFGPDGNLYVASNTDSVIKVNAMTRAASTFISEANLGPSSITFGPDGNIYVGGGGTKNGGAAFANQVRRYSGVTGLFDKVFATSSNLNVAGALAFGRDGNLYVGNSGQASVVRFNATSGIFVDTFIPSGFGGLGTNVTGLLFVPSNASSK